MASTWHSEYQWNVLCSLRCLQLRWVPFFLWAAGSSTHSSPIVKLKLTDLILMFISLTIREAILENLQIAVTSFLKFFFFSSFFVRIFLVNYNLLQYLIVGKVHVFVHESISGCSCTIVSSQYVVKVFISAPLFSVNYDIAINIVNLFLWRYNFL